ncbi:FAD-dependent oxidoreductase [Algihabitans albus]|uniref:FAD-dependent oxidoreductase n=1 Tax=Algihabitans albus TaxID=2164067 RepID=UPI000E5D1483|nr:FAD-dependent oxidoreductase [Algihabitans albus]
MPKTYSNPVFPYRRSPDQDGTDARHPVVIVGAGLVGLAAAVDLAQRGIATVVLDDDETVSFGSRAICFSKRTLEICDRLGVGQAMLDKGITWNVGRVFFGDRRVYSFDLLPESGHQFPAFVNLQQYYAEEWLVRRAEETGLVDLRWKNRVTGIDTRDEGVTLQVETPDGPYPLSCDWLLAADGAKSFVRHAMGLEFKGQVFKDRFLIADVVMKAAFPTERWFWFDPPFHRGQSALLHKQPDDVWRIDLQLGWDADPDEEKKPERVIPRLQAMLGPEVEFDLEWVSVYTFQCRRLDRFRHGRVLFVGDAAHQVSPFGARGGNGGVQDTDNLCWKLAYVLQGKAPDSLLDSYDAERVPATDENLLNSTRSTDFITPKNAASRAFRDAVLELSESQPFARSWVNSGRLSKPAVLRASTLSSTEGAGMPIPDAPIETAGASAWLLPQLGDGFVLLIYGDRMPAASDIDALSSDEVPVKVLRMAPPSHRSAAGLLIDMEGLVAERLELTPGQWLLIRPDQHVAARGERLELDLVRGARDRALGKTKAAVQAARMAG